MSSAFPPLLQLSGVTRIYDAGRDKVTAVRNVSIEVGRGEFVAVMGASGCGKSTLLHLAGAMDRPTSGEVWLAGSPLHNATEEELTRIRRTRVGFVFQFFHLLPTLTVLENVSLPLLVAGQNPASSTPRVEALLERVGLADKRNRRPRELSGGEMQRVAVARAVVHDPPLVIADEPTGNLDSGNGDRILDLLASLESAAILMATHSESAASRARRALRMRDGQLVEAGPR